LDAGVEFLPAYTADPADAAAPNAFALVTPCMPYTDLRPHHGPIRQGYGPGKAGGAYYLDLTL
jgi:hypothetical protein